MPKRRSGGRDGGRAAKRLRRRRHNLYLVFDDCLWGYSIRKVDLSSDSYSGEPPHQHTEAGEKERRLPRAAFRLEARPGYPNYFAAAFGSKIIAMTPHVDTHPMAARCAVVPLLDVRARSFAFAARPKTNLIDPVYFSVDDERLFALSSGSFQLLHLPEPEPGGDLCREPESSWRELPRQPFKREDVTAHAIHPDGRTIFVSTKRRTFTFDTGEAQHLKWKKQHGKRTLPFTGRAYFDSELDAWVGLNGDPVAIGHVCACNVASSSNSSSVDGQCLDRKVSKEKLFSEDPVEDHVGATLVYMGGSKSKYCLVQCVSVEDDCIDEELDDEARPFRYLFRLTTFSLKVDKHGHLTTGNSRRVRYYRVPEAATDYALLEPAAFWM
ncbi:unnamed protein product [Urochloa decumbens]|uniref:DUF295 domain-containing protein n=1 Tax=Urochloa decumbens TaxID=240449 RepID=A0ABC8XKM4_9POAL